MTTRVARIVGHGRVELGPLTLKDLTAIRDGLYHLSGYADNMEESERIDGLTQFVRVAIVLLGGPSV